MLLTGSRGEDEVLLADGRGSRARLSGLGGAGTHPNFRHCSGQTSRPRRRGAAHLCRALRITGNLVSPLHAEVQAGDDPGSLLLTQTPSVPLPPPHSGGPSMASSPPVWGLAHLTYLASNPFPDGTHQGHAPGPHAADTGQMG